MAGLKLKDVHKSYNQTDVITGIDLEKSVEISTQ